MLVHVEKWIQVLDYKEQCACFGVQVGPDPPQDEDELPEDAGDQELGLQWTKKRARNDLGDLVASRTASEIAVIHKEVLQVSVDSGSVDGIIIEYAANNVKGKSKDKLTTMYGLQRMVLIASKDFWTHKGTRKLWTANGNNMMAPYKVVGLRRSYDGTIWMNVVWKVIVCVESMPLGYNFFKKLKNGLDQDALSEHDWQFSSNNMFNPNLQLDAVQCTCPRSGGATEMNCKHQIGVGDVKYSRIVFEDSWICMDFKKMTQDVIFLVSHC